MGRVPHIDTDPDVVQSFLSDAAHVPGGFAAGVAFPRTAGEVAELIGDARSVLPVGAQSSLTGGATPRGELVLSTRALTGIAIDKPRKTVRVGAGVSLHTLQIALAREGLWYPPVPTYDGAFVGGTISTNAAGAATFKFGTTRDWVSSLTAVLGDGTVLPVSRGQVSAGPGGFEIAAGGTTLRVPLPQYEMPHVPKLSAGYFSRPGMDLVDLLIGSEGTLAVVVEATLQVVPRPARMVALIECANDATAVAITSALREQAMRAWSGDGPLDVAAIEYMDARSLAFVPREVYSRVNAARPAGSAALLLVQIDVPDNADASLDALAATLSKGDVDADPIVAMPGDEQGAARLFELREAVPAGVNAAIAAAKQHDEELQKTAGDFIVPFEHLASSVAIYRRAFESRQVDYAIWGHVSDGNLHPNAVPRRRDEMERGREALMESAGAVIRMGGSPLAEHGVGRSAMKQRLLEQLYGPSGVDSMRAIKRALDPAWKLSPGVLFQGR